MSDTGVPESEQPEEGEVPEGEKPAEEEEPEGEEPAEGEDPEEGEESAEGEGPEEGEEPAEGEGSEEGEEPAEGEDSEEGGESEEEEPAEEKTEGEEQITEDQEEENAASDEEDAAVSGSEEIKAPANSIIAAPSITNDVLGIEPMALDYDTSNPEEIYDLYPGDSKRLDGTIDDRNEEEWYLVDSDGQTRISPKGISLDKSWGIYSVSVDELIAEVNADAFAGPVYVAHEYDKLTGIHDWELQYERYIEYFEINVINPESTAYFYITDPNDDGKYLYCGTGTVPFGPAEDYDVDHRKVTEDLEENIVFPEGEYPVLSVDGIEYSFAYEGEGNPEENYYTIDWDVYTVASGADDADGNPIEGTYEEHLFWTEKFPTWHVDGIAKLHKAEESETFTLTLDGNGDGKAPEVIDVPKDKPQVTLPGKDSMTKENAVFAGWSETQYEVIDDYVDYMDKKSSIVDHNYTVTDDTTLYAVWLEDLNDDLKADIDQIKITFDLNREGVNFTNCQEGGILTSDGDLIYIYNEDDSSTEAFPASPKVDAEDFINWQSDNYGDYEESFKKNFPTIGDLRFAYGGTKLHQVFKAQYSEDPGPEARYVNLIFHDVDTNEYIEKEKAFEISAEATTVTKDQIADHLPEGYEIVDMPSDGIYSIAGDDWVAVDIKKIAVEPETKEVGVNYWDVVNNKQAGEGKVEVDYEATQVNTGKLTDIPAGYELATLGDVDINDGWIYVEVRPLPETKEVGVNYWDVVNNKQAGEGKVEVDYEATQVNTGKLTDIPVGYELATLGDVDINDGWIYVEVRPATQTVGVNYYDRENDVQVKESSITVPADAIHVNTSELTDIPEGYELVVTGDLPIMDGWIYVEIKLQTKEIGVNYWDIVNNRQVIEGKVIVPINAYNVNTSDLTDIPAGYELVKKGDIQIMDGWIYVEVRPEDEQPLLKTVGVNYWDIVNNSHVTDGSVTVAAVATHVNTSKLTDIPAGYELVWTGDIMINDGWIWVEVRPEEAEEPTTKIVGVNYWDVVNNKQVTESKVEVAADATNVNTSMLTDVPAGYELVWTGDIPINGGWIWVEVTPATSKTVGVNYWDIENDVQVKEDKITVAADANNVHSSELNVPEGYELVWTGDYQIMDGWIYVELRPVETEPTKQVVGVNYWDVDNNVQAGEGKVTVEADATAVNTTTLTDVPEGYEIVWLGDVQINDGWIYVEVRKATTKVVGVNYWDVDNNVQVAEGEVTVAADAYNVNSSELTDIPAGYELVNVGDFQINDGWIYVEVKKTAEPSEQVVGVNYWDVDQDVQAGEGEITVAADATTVNTTTLTDVPEGYELVWLGDVQINDGWIYVEVRKPLAKDVVIEYWDTVNDAQVGEDSKLTVEGDATYINTGDLTDVPEGYELVWSGDLPITDGKVRVELRPIDENKDGIPDIAQPHVTLTPYETTVYAGGRNSEEATGFPELELQVTEEDGTVRSVEEERVSAVILNGKRFEGSIADYFKAIYVYRDEATQNYVIIDKDADGAGYDVITVIAVRDTAKEAFAENYGVNSGLLVNPETGRFVTVNTSESAASEIKSFGIEAEDPDDSTKILNYYVNVASGSLTVRDVNNTDVYRDIVTNEDAVDTSDGYATAYVESSSQFLTNGEESRNKATANDVRLLVDDVKQDARVGYIEDAGFAEAYGMTAEEAEAAGYSSMIKYFDLVDSGNGNAWVQSTEGTSVYIPYPEGTNADTEFELVHFIGLHREDNAYYEAGDAELQAVINGATLEGNEALKVETTDQGIRFYTDGKDAFSPFMLMWKTAGGTETDPGTDDDDDNKDDHGPTTPVSVSNGSSSSDYHYTVGINGNWVHMDNVDVNAPLDEPVPEGATAVEFPEWHRWKFYRMNGTILCNQWAYVENPYAVDDQPRTGWFYFDYDGLMRYGWYLDTRTGDWYYLHSESDGMLGTMMTGWHYDMRDGKWYYLDPATGAMKTGWQQIGGKWYYFNPTPFGETWTLDHSTSVWRFNGNTVRPYGSMYQNEVTPDGYKVGEDGAWIQ